jgi:hypothetical protein
MTAQESVTFGSVPMSVSMPENLSWHMILDHELSQLTLPEAGVLGSLGFVFLGGALGLIPGFVVAVEKVPHGAAAQVKDGLAAQVFTSGDLATVIAFCACAALALVCLIIAGLRWTRNRGLAAKIRSRSKHGFTFAGQPSSAASA